MSERYTRLFSLPENLYAEGSPVIIAAGSLLKDNQTGKVLAQLKLRNIAQKTIKAVTVCVEPLDTVGKPLGEVVSYQYLDLHADRDIDFGQKSPIALPDAATRSFAVSVSEVIFTDNSIWNSVSLPWEALNKPASLDSLHDSELAKQFRMEFGSSCEILPLEQKDLWFCVCGALNRKEEASCHRCSKTLSTLQSFDMDELRRKKDARRAEERERAEKEAEEVRKKEEAAREKARKVGKIAAIVVPILTIILVAAVIISGMMKKNDAYDNALALMDAGQYEEAITAFTSLDGYKDSAEQIHLAEAAIAELERAAELEATYNNAIQLLQSNVSANENEAYHILTELGDYKDATELLTKFQYQVIAEEGLLDSREYLMFYEYDDRGLLTEKQYDGGATLSYRYNEDGKLVREIGSQNWDTTDYQYNDNGIISRIKHAQARTVSSGNIDYLTTDYDDNGNPIKIQNDLEGCAWTFVYHYAADGTIASVDCTVRRTNQEYSTTVNLVDNGWELYHTPTDWGLIFKETNGNQITTYAFIISYIEGLVTAKSGVCEFDAYGNPIQETMFDKQGRINISYHYENSYDEMGNLTQTKRQAAGSDIVVEYNYIYGYIYTPNAA